MSEAEEQEVEQEQEESQEEESQEEVTFESLAREQGWNPDYDGANKLTAVEFLRNARPIQENLKQRVEHLTGTVEKLTVNFAKDRKAKAEQEARELKARQLEAVENADKETYQEITQELEKVSKRDRTAEFDAGLEAVKRENDWLGKDRLMTAEFDLLGTAILTSDSDIEPDEFYKEVLRGVKHKFPEKFQNPNRSRPSSVEGDTTPINRSGGSAWDRAKKEAPGLEAAFMEWVNDGLYKNTKGAREEFAKKVLED